MVYYLYYLSCKLKKTFILKCKRFLFIYSLWFACKPILWTFLAFCSSHIRTCIMHLGSLVLGHFATNIQKLKLTFHSFELNIINQWISVNLTWLLNNTALCWIVNATTPSRLNSHTYLQRPSWSRPGAQPGFFPWHMGVAGKALWARSQRI